jgi:hypothetical protein
MRAPASAWCQRAPRRAIGRANCAGEHSSTATGRLTFGSMATKYFTHFVTGADEARFASEWSGVVELTRPLEGRKGAQRELREMIAENFELDSAEIRILHWARLH